MNAWTPEQRYGPTTKKLYETRLNNPPCALGCADGGTASGMG
jgi:hypothetical protein